jgi:hypothetical protein
VRGVLKLLHGQHPDMKVGIACCAIFCSEGMVQPPETAEHSYQETGCTCSGPQATKAGPLAPKVHQQNGVTTRNSNLRNGDLRVDLADSRTRAKVA